MKRILVFIFLFTCLTNMFGQSDKVGYLKSSMYDLVGGIGNNEIMTSLSWLHTHGLGHKKKLKLGYGLRLTTYFGSGVNYSTATAKYTIDEKTIDTLQFAKAQSNLLNINLQVTYTVFKKLDLGFNIDAFGFGFGKKSQASIISSSSSNSFSSIASVPTKLNMLLVGDNDKGNLSSEFYLRYWINEKIGLRAGFNYLFTEYTTEKTLAFNNNEVMVDRFRRKSGLFFLGVTLKAL